VKSFKIAILLLLLGLNLSGQDLIERTQMQLSINQSGKRTKMSKKINLQEKFDEIAPFQINTKKTQYATKSHSYGEIYLDIDKSLFKAFKKKSQKKLSIPVSADRSFDLLLYPVDPISFGSKVYNEKGEELEVSRSQFYRGIVSDDPGSIASVAVNDEVISIVISDARGNYNVGQVEDGSSYVLFNDANLGTFPFDCKNEEITLPSLEELAKTKKYKIEKNANENCVKVYIETDYITYVNFNRDAQAVVNFIEGTFNAVSTLYNNIEVSIQLSDIQVWTNDDPYGAETNVSTALSYVSNNVSNFNGDLFHLVSAIGNCCSWSGVGYVSSGNRPGLFNGSTVCGPNPFAVSQTTLFYNLLPSYSWSVNVMAHEMGHNMGAPHTHECAWGPGNNTPLDGCVTPQGCANPGLPAQGAGTIMSYCHINPNVGISLANGFHPEVGTHIRSEYEERTCLAACGPIDGCTDEFSHGYNPMANVDDGSCEGTCDDGIQNGDETGVDCGGNLCVPCNFSCDDHHIRLIITFDQYASENSWDLKNNTGTVIETSENYASKVENETITIDWCLPDGTYEFTMYDSYNDGMCCAYGNGSFRLINDSEGVFFTGSVFTNKLSTTFALSSGQNTCSDQIQNGDEEGIDCGGSSCAPCTQGYVCDNPNILTQSWIETFENTTINWSQSSNDDMDWLRQTGPTPSSGTGPNSAAQGNYYLFIESSAPNFPAKTAELISPCLLLSNLYSPNLEFNYHMYGVQMGDLYVEVEILKTGERAIIWDMSGDQGNTWHAATISLDAFKNESIKIRIIGVTGSSFASDMAIDELSIIESVSNTCHDGIQNGTELGIDCGGDSCIPCLDCQDQEYNFTTEQNFSGNSEKVVKQRITTNAKIIMQQNSNVMWQAGTAIEINGEFEIMAGAQLLLSTADCKE
jgi:hypothetical protein